MPNGPFVTTEGGNTIAKFAYEKLIPAVEKLSELAIKVSNFRYNFFAGFKKIELHKLDKDYKKTSKIFFEVYKEWHTPDILFKDLKDKKDATILLDYFNTRAAINEHINEGFRLIDFIDGVITGQNTAFYNRAAIELSILAIVISIILTMKPWQLIP